MQQVKFWKYAFSLLPAKVVFDYGSGNMLSYTPVKLALSQKLALKHHNTLSSTQLSFNEVVSWPIMIAETKRYALAVCLSSSGRVLYRYKGLLNWQRPIPTELQEPFRGCRAGDKLVRRAVTVVEICGASSWPSWAMSIISSAMSRQDSPAASVACGPTPYVLVLISAYILLVVLYRVVCSYIQGAVRDTWISPRD